MPLVTIRLLEGRTLRDKEALAEEITRAVMKAAKVDRDHVWVIIEEIKRENWAVGGALFSRTNTS